MGETFTRDKRVIASSSDLLKYFVLHPESKELTKQLCVKAFLTDEVLKAVGLQLGNGGFNAVQSEVF